MSLESRKNGGVRKPGATQKGKGGGTLKALDRNVVKIRQEKKPQSPDGTPLKRTGRCKPKGNVTRQSHRKVKRDPRIDCNRGKESKEVRAKPESKAGGKIGGVKTSG